jgi:hypothetical protein
MAGLSDKGSFDCGCSLRDAQRTILAQDDNVVKGAKLDFRVKNETYFLDLAENERQWLVFVDTPNGPRSIPVYEDAPSLQDEDVKVVVEDNQRRKIVN